MRGKRNSSCEKCTDSYVSHGKWETPRWFLASLLLVLLLSLKIFICQFVWLEQLRDESERSESETRCLDCPPSSFMVLNHTNKVKVDKIYDAPCAYDKLPHLHVLFKWSTAGAIATTHSPQRSFPLHCCYLLASHWSHPSFFLNIINYLQFIDF